MAIVENSTLISVTHKVNGNKLVVEWRTEIVKNGAKVLARYDERKVYDATEKTKLETALGADAAKYILMAGW